MKDQCKAAKNRTNETKLKQQKQNDFGFECIYCIKKQFTILFELQNIITSIVVSIEHHFHVFSN